MFDYRKAKHGGTEKEILAYENKSKHESKSQEKKEHMAKKMTTEEMIKEKAYKAAKSGNHGQSRELLSQMFKGRKTPWAK